MTSVNGTADEPGRRRSGRAVRKPEPFAGGLYDNTSFHNGASKRKRPSGRAAGQEDNDDEEEIDDDEPTSENSADDESDEKPDAEEVRERNKRKKKSTITKPATKRPKTANGSSTTLAIRPAIAPVKSTSKLTKQKARSRPSQIQASGLYAEVFGKGRSGDDAAAIWHDALLLDNVGGIRELVNFILQCVGCEARIENTDVEDVDNVPTRLGDILDEYALQKTIEYPLSSRLKQFTGFKEVLMEFSKAVVHSLHNSGLLYSQPAVYDNIHIWTATMSGAGYRPFRHTATVISLSMTTSLCEVAQELQSSMATTKTQIEAEKKKKKANKSRLTELQAEQEKDEKRLEAVDALLRDAFDTVYVHRYRDVDEKIRVECVNALGSWIMLYRKMFLEGQYLRYLGWVLSDPNALTRLEVIKALKGLFKNRSNVGALRAFTDRFRARLVEMGARDTDTSVRAEAIELLDRLRNAELLEPDDIDTIGRLIFDNEPRIRKAVAKFFVSNIEDLYQAIVEDYDQETYASTLPTSADEDDFMEPNQSWIKFKCLAQTLVTHDTDNESRKSGERNYETYGPEEVQSRFMLATQSIYPYMPELSQWESLSGYLLYDHSGIKAKADNADVSLAVQGAFKLGSGEDMALLDVLYLSFKLTLQQILDGQAEKKAKKSQTSKSDIIKKQEAAANHLTAIIPQLLSKFGSTPEAAASILRLEQLLNIDLIADLQAGEATYETILENINKQFISHNDRKVLAEASKALRTARTYETSKESADAKVAEIWSDSREALSSLLRNKNITTRGTLDRNVLREVGDVMGRLAQLAAVSDCTEALESGMAGGATKKAKRQSAAIDIPNTLLQALHGLLRRGNYDENITEQFAELEDRLCGFVMTVLSFYFRWKVVNLKNAISSKDTKSLSSSSLQKLNEARLKFIEDLHPAIITRQPLEPLRVSAVLTILDLSTLFATIRYMRPDKGDLSEETQTDIQNLVTNIPAELVENIMETHEKLEKRLAKKTKKRIDTPFEDKLKSKNKKRQSGATADAEPTEDDVEKPPEDSDDEEEAAQASSSEDEGLEESDEETQASGSRGREARKQSALIAEQALCEYTSKIVLAVIASVIRDFSGGAIRARLQVNRSRLGKSYNQVIAYLDEKKEKKKPKRKSEEARQVVKEKEKQTRLSELMVIEEDDIEDEDDEEHEEEEAEREDGNADAEVEEGAEERQEEDDEVMGD